MVSTEDLAKVRVRIVRHGTFYSLAKNHLELCKTAQKRINSVQDSHIDSGFNQQEDERDIQSLIAPLLYEVDKNAIATIVFSAFSLEAYIFDYGASNISKSYVDKYLDKLDLVAKWIIIPKLINDGNGISTSCHALEELRFLVKLRNDFVHYKCETKQLGTEIRPLVHFDDAARAIKVVPALLDKLKSIDPGIDTDWLADDTIYRLDWRAPPN